MTAPQRSLGEHIAENLNGKLIFRKPEIPLGDTLAVFPEDVFDEFHEVLLSDFVDLEIVGILAYHYLFDQKYIGHIKACPSGCHSGRLAGSLLPDITVCMYYAVNSANAQRNVLCISVHAHLEENREMPKSEK